MKQIYSNDGNQTTKWIWKKIYCAISYWIFLTETKIFNSNWEVLSLQVIKKDEKFLAPERWVSWLVRLRRMLNRRIFFVWWISFQFFGEVGELAETNGLLNRRTGNTVPRVRISPSPQLLLNRNDYIVWFLPISTDFIFIPDLSLEIFFWYNKRPAKKICSGPKSFKPTSPFHCKW